MFVVDFEVGYTDGIRDVGGNVGFDSLEEVFAGPGDETWLGRGAHHCIRLAGSRLAICKNTRVVPFEVMVQELFAKGIVYVLLMGVMFVLGIMRPKGVVKGELLLFHYLTALSPDIGSVGGVWDQQSCSFCSRVHLYQTLCASLKLCDRFSTGVMK